MKRNVILYSKLTKLRNLVKISESAVHKIVQKRTNKNSRNIKKKIRTNKRGEKNLTLKWMLSKKNSKWEDLQEIH